MLKLRMSSLRLLAQRRRMMTAGAQPAVNVWRCVHEIKADAASAVASDRVTLDHNIQKACCFDLHRSIGYCFATLWRGGGAAERAGFENRSARKGSASSNLALSAAIHSEKPQFERLYCYSGSRQKRQR